jgi:hypothetical protein
VFWEFQMSQERLLSQYSREKRAGLNDLQNTTLNVNQVERGILHDWKCYEYSPVLTILWFKTERQQAGYEVSVLKTFKWFTRVHVFPYVCSWGFIFPKFSSLIEFRGLYNIVKEFRQKCVILGVRNIYIYIF